MRRTKGGVYISLYGFGAGLLYSAYVTIMVSVADMVRAWTIPQKEGSFIPEAAIEYSIVVLQSAAWAVVLFCAVWYGNFRGLLRLVNSSDGGGSLNSGRVDPFENHSGGALFFGLFCATQYAILGGLSFFREITGRDLHQIAVLSLVFFAQGLAMLLACILVYSVSRTTLTLLTSGRSNRAAFKVALTIAVSVSLLMSASSSALFLFLWNALNLGTTFRNIPNPLPDGDFPWEAVTDAISSCIVAFAAGLVLFLLQFYQRNRHKAIG